MEGTVVKCEGEAGMNREMGNARVVKLKSGRLGPCLFLVPGIGGRIEGFGNLANSLQTPMPIFAIEARGLDESSVPDTSVEEMARHYLTRVQTVQSLGPYFLAGHSFGGLVVLEMAQRLIEAKERVACLIMLDTPTSETYWPLPLYVNYLKARLHRHLKRILALPVKENLKFYWGFRHLFLLRADLNRMPVDVMIGDNVGRVVVGHNIAREKYSPKFYTDKLTFFRPSEGNGFELLWLNRVGVLEIHSAAGDHHSMIQPPNVLSLASDMSECLMKALAAMTPTPSSLLD